MHPGKCSEAASVSNDHCWKPSSSSSSPSSDSSLWRFSSCSRFRSSPTTSYTIRQQPHQPHPPELTPSGSVKPVCVRAHLRGGAGRPGRPGRPGRLRPSSPRLPAQHVCVIGMLKVTAQLEQLTAAFHRNHKRPLGKQLTRRTKNGRVRGRVRVRDAG